MAELADIGVLGLAVMGANLARNAARKGFGVALYNRHPRPHRRADARAASEGRFFPAKTLSEFVAAIAKPRAIIVMVKAGKPVDDVIDELLPHLEPGDILIDGGNSLYTDTNRRFAELKDTGIRFIGMGVSGRRGGGAERPEHDARRRARRLRAHRADRAQDGGAGRWHAVRRLSSGRRAPATTSRWCTTASNMPTCSLSPRPTIS